MGSIMNDNLHINRGDTEFLINYLISTLSLLMQDQSDAVKSGDVVNFPKNLEWIYKKPVGVSRDQMSIFEEE